MACHSKFPGQQFAKLEVFGYMEGFYNTKRIHSALRHKTPQEIENMLLKKGKAAT